MKRFALLIVCLAFLASGSGCCLWGPYGCGGGGGYGGGCNTGGGCPGGCGYGTGYGPSYSPYGTPTTYYGGGPTVATYPYYPQMTAGVPLQAVPQ